MPIIFGGFFLLPLVLGAVLEYLVFRLTMLRRRWLRVLPPLLLGALGALVGWRRYLLWYSPEFSPVTQLLFVPGLPALGGFLGMVLGWRLWRRLWLPRVVRDPGRKP